MVRRACAQRSVFEVLLPDADKLWDPALRHMPNLEILCLIRLQPPCCYCANDTLVGRIEVAVPRNMCQDKRVRHPITTSRASIT